MVRDVLSGFLTMTQALKSPPYEKIPPLLLRDCAV